MADKLVKIAAYSIPVEAHAARGLLEAEGIRAFLEGEQAVNVFSGASCQIKLNVAESDAARATALLAEIEAGPPPDDSHLWLCPLCGDAVDLDEDACPACATPRPETWQVRSAALGPPLNSSSEDIQSEAPPDRSAVTSDTPIEALDWTREDEEEDRSAREPSVLHGRGRRTVAVGLVSVWTALLAAGLIVGLILLVAQVVHNLLH